MRAEFEQFSRPESSRPPIDALIEPMKREDIGPCARLAAAREGDAVERWISAFHRVMDSAQEFVLVGRHDDHVVGYGKAAWLHLAPETLAPSGWYLTGVVVDPPSRRCGVGELLTLARLDELRQRGAQQVWFFANARNQASLALHERVGFREVSRRFTIPGVTFDGGVGVLSCWDSRREPTETVGAR